MKCYYNSMSRFTLLLAVIVGVTLFFSRWVYLIPTDWAHLQDRFGNSQWRIPNSSRVISDSELYQVAGKELVEGEDPFLINPEVPPVAKYIYGFTGKMTGNAHWASLVLYV